LKLKPQARTQWPEPDLKQLFDETRVANDIIDMIANELVLNHLLLRFDDVIALKSRSSKGHIFFDPITGAI
jgi:hypothetical protein